MNWQTILFSIIGIVLTTLVSWGAERLIAYINTKLVNTKYAKYLSDAIDIVTRAVKTTYQTYVETLKDKNIFNGEAQKDAVAKAKDIAVSQLTTDTKKYIEKNFGDIESWIANTVEAVIYDLKMN